LLNSGSWLRSQSGRIVSGLGLAASSWQVADAARKGGRRADGQERKDDTGNNRDTSEKSTQSETDSDQQNDGKASAESRDSNTKSDNSGKHNRNETASQNDDSHNQSTTDSEKTQGGSQRNDASNSDSRHTSGEDGNSHQHGSRHVQQFEQHADKSTGDSSTGDSPNDAPNHTAVTPANPNVDMSHVPSSSIADLVVNANDHVVATVSSSGGFAFARSGDVIAVSGPDGASIIQTGNVSAGTRGTSPAEPSSDGGNNDMSFSS
jgi:hypothetical protein